MGATGEAERAVATRPALRFGLLGPLGVSRDEQPLALGPLKQQQVLALLLCRPNALTGVDLLIDTLWADQPPRTARKNLQVYIACLRKLLGTDGSEDRLSHVNGGYRLRVAEDELDLLQFRRLAVDARASAQPHERIAKLSAALKLWRGPALDGLTRAPQLDAEAQRLNLGYLAVFEDWAEAQLAAGAAAVVVEQLGEMVGRHPFRERLRQLQMTALHRVGRQAEALAEFDQLRLSLARELGLQPSPASQQLYRALLGAGSPPDRPRPSRSAVAPVVLPPDLTDFTGRAEEHDRLHKLLASPSSGPLLISGPVGIGKTSLAIRVAHRCAEQFPDGRVFVRARTEQGVPRDVGSMLAGLLRLAGVALPSQTAAGWDVDELASRWQRWLMNRRVLIILDDVAASSLVQAVQPRSGASRLMVTTRWLMAETSAAARVELPPMSSDEGLELLGRIIGEPRVRAECSAAEQTVQLIGLSPLAIRTVGAKLSALKHLSLVEFAGRLTDPDDLLAEISTGECALRGRLADGLVNLAEPQRSALRRLGALNSRAFTLEQAASALAEGSGRVRRLLESLIEANTLTVPAAEVTAHGTVYELPGLLRCYLRELPAL